MFSKRTSINLERNQICFGFEFGAKIY